jgi:hypothetical protein
MFQIDPRLCVAKMASQDFSPWPLGLFVPVVPLSGGRDDIFMFVQGMRGGGAASCVFSRYYLYKKRRALRK